MIAEEQSRDPQGGGEAAEDPVSEEEEVKTLPRVDGGQASDAAASADETMRTDLRRPIEGEVSEEKRLKSDDAMLSELMGSQAAASSGQSGGAQMVDDQDDPGSPVKKPRVACVGFYPPMFAGVNAVSMRETDDEELEWCVPEEEDSSWTKKLRTLELEKIQSSQQRNLQKWQRRNWSNWTWTQQGQK